MATPVRRKSEPACHVCLLPRKENGAGLVAHRFQPLFFAVGCLVRAVCRPLQRYGTGDEIKKGSRGALPSPVSSRVTRVFGAVWGEGGGWDE